MVLPRHIIDLIRRTSRSFHLTLRALPRAVRNEVSLLYLLARTADTLADSLHGEGDVLIEAFATLLALGRWRARPPRLISAT